VTDLPSPRASRLPRARWLDTRLLLGLLLVLVAVVLGAKVLADADERVEVWSVTRDLGSDTVLTSSDVTVAAVRLDEVARSYVAASEDVDGIVLTRPVGRGELLPLSAVTEDDAPDLRRVVIEVDRYGVTGLGKGRVVDVYVVPDEVAGEDVPPPELVLGSVTVAEDVRGDGAFGASGDKAAVTLLVRSADVESVIDAVAHGSVYLVHVPAGAS
jgi:hypothetical protein